MPQSLLLDPETWDVVLDQNGNLPLAPEPWSLAQDAASAIRLFEGELYYDTRQGIPYWRDILGKWPPLSLLKEYFVTAAMSVPKVVDAKCYIASIGSDRLVHGQIQVTDVDGNLSIANF